MKTYDMNDLCGILHESKFQITLRIYAAGLDQCRGGGKNEMGFLLNSKQIAVLKNTAIPRKFRDTLERRKLLLQGDNTVYKRGYARCLDCIEYKSCLQTAAVQDSRLNCSGCNRYQSARINGLAAFSY